MILRNKSKEKYHLFLKRTLTMRRRKTLNFLQGILLQHMAYLPEKITLNTWVNQLISKTLYIIVKLIYLVVSAKMISS